VVASLEAMRPTIGNETGRLVTSARSSIDEMEHLSLSETVVEDFAKDEFPDAFPGLSLTHLLIVTTQDRLALAIDILNAIGASGGEIECSRMTKCGEGLKHQFRLCGLGSGQARLLSQDLAALPGVSRTTVEHQLLRR
jgi:hypothetical protein